MATRKKPNELPAAATRRRVRVMNRPNAMASPPTEGELAGSLSGALRAISSQGANSKFFPYGITKIDLTLNLATGIGATLHIEGPSSPPPDPKRAKAIHVGETAFHLGFDSYDIPSPDQLDALRNAQHAFSWCGYYLTHRSDSKSTSWTGQRANLVANQWNPVPLFVPDAIADTNVPDGLKGPDGVNDGDYAAKLLQQDGFPTVTVIGGTVTQGGAVVYLDIENGNPLTADGQAYVQQWTTAVVAAGYSPGFYCSYLRAAEIKALVDGINLQVPGTSTPVTVLYWCWRLVKGTADAQNPVNLGTPIAEEVPSDPAAGSTVSFANFWQYGQNLLLDQDAGAIHNLRLDLSASDRADPGNS